MSNTALTVVKPDIYKSLHIGSFTSSRLALFIERSTGRLPTSMEASFLETSALANPEYRPYHRPSTDSAHIPVLLDRRCTHLFTARYLMS